MAQNTELQERYSSLVLKKLRKTAVIRNCFNTHYEGNPTAGAVKIPVRDTEVVVGTYNITNGGSLNVPTTTYKTLITDNDLYVNELIDGYYASAVPDNMRAERLDSAGYNLGVSVDDILVTLLTTTGNFTASQTATATAIDKDNVYSAIIKDVQKAKKVGAKTDEMFLIVPNETYEILLNSPKFIQATDKGDGVIANGVIGWIGGVKVIETNNIPDTAKVDYILGNSAFCHFVEEWKTPVAIEDLKDGKHIGSSAVQGRLVFGALVSRPTTVYVKKHS